jgi:hypothetical protein
MAKESKNKVIRASRQPILRDLTDPKVIAAIWEEADRAGRADRVRRVTRLA